MPNMIMIATVPPTVRIVNLINSIVCFIVPLCLFFILTQKGDMSTALLKLFTTTACSVIR